MLCLKTQRMLKYFGVSNKKRHKKTPLGAITYKAADMAALELPVAKARRLFRRNTRICLPCSSTLPLGSSVEDRILG